MIIRAIQAAITGTFTNVPGVLAGAGIAENNFLGQTDFPSHLKLPLLLSFLMMSLVVADNGMELSGMRPLFVKIAIGKQNIAIAVLSVFRANTRFKQEGNIRRTFIKKHHISFTHNSDSGPPY
jgi:hypothetical protein